MILTRDKGEGRADLEAELVIGKQRRTRITAYLIILTTTCPACRSDKQTVPMI